MCLFSMSVTLLQYRTVGPVYSLFSSWVTMTGRLLGPKMVFSIFLKDTVMHYYIGSQTTVLQSFNH